MKSNVSTWGFKRVGFAIGLILVLALSNTALADDGGTWEHTSPYWQATYWNNTSLWGTPVVQRQERNLNHHWGFRSPHFRVQADRFSARWTRTAHFEPGSYRFTTTTDDGVRLWVNQHLLIDNWRDQALASHSGTMYLEGDVALKMEYYENRGVAAARLTWEREGENPASAVERILFAPGATQTTVEGYLPANDSRVYVMRVAAGQYVAMDATVAAGLSGAQLSRGLRFSIVGADGTVVKPMGEAHVRTVVPRTQDYTVELVSDVGAVSYRMSVLIPVRIRFAPGATSADVTGSLAANGTRHYVLRALAGQRMIVVPHTVQRPVRLTISGADGQVLLSGRVGHPGGVYDGILPTTQDYLITVRAEGGTGADYTLEITIPPL